MKPKPSPSPKQRAKRLPKARVMHGISNKKHTAVCITELDHRISHLLVGGEFEISVAVLPTRTQQQASQLVRWANLSYAQKVGELAETLAAYVYGDSLRELAPSYQQACREIAATALNLLGESPDPEN